MITLIDDMESYVLQRKSKNESLTLPRGILANFLRIVELVKEFGPDLGRPHTAPLEPKLIEIRAKGKEGIARAVFCAVKGKEIVILMTVIKKTNKIPKRQMEIARKRMKEVQDD